MKMRVCILIAVASTVAFSLKGQTRFIARVKSEHLQDMRNAEALGERLRKSIPALKNPDIMIEPLLEYENMDTVGNGLFLITSREFLQDSSRFAGVLEYIEPDHVGYAAGIQVPQTVHPDDPAFQEQWYLNNDGTFNYGNPKVGADIQMLNAWDITQGDSAVTVAILDSGINPEHPEFQGRFWKETSGDKIGWDFINDDNDPRDDNGHGTAVAGILAANANNGIGFAGIEQRCKLMICKVLDQNLSGFYSQWIAGLYYAVRHGARIINFSLGGTEPSRALQEAIEYAESMGVLVVVAIQNYNTDKPYYPAAYPQTVAVGSTDPDDNRSIRFNNSWIYGSNFGSHIDVVAPGNYIFGLDKSSGIGSSRLLWAGTSMSAPIVSGIAALLLAQDPSRTARDLKAILFATAEDQVGDIKEDKPGWDQYYGYGRINAFNALTATGRPLLVENKPALYPNPSHGNVTVEVMQSLDSPVHITIFDSKGQNVAGFLLESHNERVVKETLDLNFLSSGIYLVKLRTKFIVHTERILIR